MDVETTSLVTAATEPSAAPGKIALVIEADLLLAINLEQDLAAFGYSVYSAPTVAAAEHILDTCRPDLAFLDVAARDGSTSRVAERLSLARIPWVVVSNLKPVPQGQDAIFLSRPFLPKAYYPTQLEAVISAGTSRQPWP
ncbi:hypothetical protein LJR030_002947 [Rhizobium sp. LjRoot30]|uniref:hypothetical protein n=1 Tax=Rhizobium sp. LjRoot30 TaxID=3342320 RepID=UPI003ECC1B5E